MRRTCLTLCLLLAPALCRAQAPDGYTLLSAMLARQATVASDQSKLSAAQATLTADQASAAGATSAFVTYLSGAGGQPRSRRGHAILFKSGRIP